MLIAAHGLEQRVLDLETGQRGFILTRQPQFLVPWQQAREALPKQERALLELVRSDSAQAARVRAIARAVRSYIDDYSLPLVKAAARADPAAKTVAATAEGEARTRVIRGDFAQLLETERRTSAATARASASAAHRAYAGLVVGIGASIALVALYAGYLTRAIVGPIRRAATLAGRVAGGDLTARLPETGVGEVGALQRAFNVMGASLERGRDELTALADEQAGLRRVATLVAQGASAGDVLAAVAAGIGQLLPADCVLIGRYDGDGGDVTTVGRWSRDAGPADLPAEWGAGVRKLAALVRRTGGRPERSPTSRPSSLSPRMVAHRIRSSVGVPINVEAELWGIVIAASTREEPMPDATETRLGSFTELVSTAIANADAKAALTASRARVVVTADETRRRFTRDLHDGAQRRVRQCDPAAALGAGSGAARSPRGRRRARCRRRRVERCDRRASRLRTRDSPREPDQGRTSPGAGRAGSASPPCRSIWTCGWMAACPRRSRSPRTTSSPRRSRTRPNTRMRRA